MNLEENLQAVQSTSCEQVACCLQMEHHPTDRPMDTDRDQPQSEAHGFAI
jgi:hypothetical protein